MPKSQLSPTLHALDGRHMHRVTRWLWPLESETTALGKDWGRVHRCSRLSHRERAGAHCHDANAAPGAGAEGLSLAAWGVCVGKVSRNGDEGSSRGTAPTQGQAVPGGRGAVPEQPWARARACCRLGHQTRPGTCGGTEGVSGSCGCWPPPPAPGALWW